MRRASAATGKSTEISDFSIKLTSPSELVSFRQSLLLLSVAVALVLLIACGNVAHLLLARTASRHRELAIRAAMGATRVRLVRQLLTESLLLAFAGCIGGIVIGWLALHALVAMRPDSLARARRGSDGWDGAHGDGGTRRTDGHHRRPPGDAAFRAVLCKRRVEGGCHSVSQSRRQRRFRAVLVTSEMAVSTVLLVGSTLLIRSIVHLQTVDPGFNPSRLYAFQLSLKQVYPTTDSRRAFLAEVAARMRQVSGVEGVTISTARLRRGAF